MPTGLGDEQLWLCPTLDNATPFSDLSDQGNNGTAVGGLATVADTGAGGAYCYDLDGVDDYIDCGTGVMTNTSFSVSCWFNTDIVHGSFLGSYDWTANKRSFYLQLLNGKVQFRVATSATSSGTVIESATTVSTGTWVHVAATWDATSGEMEVFINGSTEATGTQSQMASLLDPLTVGSFGSADNDYDGKQDDIRVFQRVLTQSEITHLATARGIEGRPFDGLGDEQLWLCPSLENSPNDLSGNNNNGVYNGGMGTVTSDGKLAYNLDGIDDYIDCGAIGVSSGLSISAWIKRDEVANFVGIVTRYDEAAGTDSCYYLMSSAFTRHGIRLYASQGGGVLKSEDYADSVGDASWSHVAMRVGLGTDRGEIFVDGLKVVSVQIDNDNMSSFLDTAGMDTLVGARRNSTGASKYFNGLMDDIRIYNRVLTQAEISWLATERGVLGTPPEGLGDEQLWLCPSIQDSPNDLSGNGNDGTYNGGMGTIADTSNGGSRAYDLDGIDDYLKVDNSIEFGAVSVSCWAYSDLTFPTFRVIDLYDLSRSTGSPDIVIQHINYSSYRAFSQISGAPTTASHSVTPAQWHHLCTVFDGTNLNLYVDGSLAVSVASTDTPQSDRAFFGSRTGTSEYMDGKMDDIRAYDRVLTPAEISWLATERGVLGTPPEGLGDEQLWLCPSIQDSANDISANNNHGTYNGGMGTIADTAEGGSLAYDFDGTDDFISLGDITSSSQAEFCVSAWVKRSSSDSNVIMAKRNNTDYQWDMSKSGTDIVYFGPNDNANRANSGSTALSLNQWDHVTCQVSATQVEVYINGTLEGTHAYTGGVTDTSASMTVGRRGMTSPNEGYFTGYMDDIRTYERALTQAEITHLASQRGVLGAPALPEGLGDEQLWLCPSIDDSPDDLSGNGNNGTYNGGMGTVTSDGKLCYDFDGTDDYIDIASSGISTPTSAYSISVWVNPSVTTLFHVFIAGQTNGLRFANLGNNNANGNILCGQSNDWLQAGSYDLNQWQCVCYTYDGTTVSLYKNGALIGSRTDAPVSYTEQLVRMGADAFGSNLLGGKTDDLRTYNRALTQAEITHLASQRGVLGAPDTCDMLTDMTFWSDLSDGTSASLADDNGGSDVLTRNGGTTDATGSPRSSACVNYGASLSNYHSLNGGANQPAPPSDYSFSIWAKCTGTGSVGAWIANQRLGGATSGWNIFRRSSNGLVNFSEVAGGSAARQVEVTPMSLDTWYLLSFSRNDTGLSAYVNGSLVGSDTTSMTQGTDAAPLIIGGAAWDPANSATKFNGYLWSCGMWDRVLTASEHSQLYQSGQGLLYNEICSSGPPASVFFNPFSSKTFHPFNNKRIR